MNRHYPISSHYVVYWLPVPITDSLKTHIPTHNVLSLRSSLNFIVVVVSGLTWAQAPRHTFGIGLKRPGKLYIDQILNFLYSTNTL